MSGILSPAVSTANRMSFTTKLAVVALIFLIPYLVILAINVTRAVEEINVVERQLVGVDIALKLKPVAIEMAKHRGNMAQVLSGATDKEAAVQASEVTVERALKEVENTLDTSGYRLAQFSAVQSKWQTLKAVKSGVATTKNFSEHTLLIEDVHKLIGTVKYDFKLTLHDQMSNQFLAITLLDKVPQLAEELGRLRGKGAAALHDKAINVNERVLLENMLSSLRSVNEMMSEDIAMLFRESAIQTHLSGPVNNYYAKEKLFADTLETQVVEPDEPLITAARYFELGSQAIEALEAFDKDVSDEFISRMEALYAKRKMNRNEMIALGILTVLVGLYISIGIQVALTTSAQSLNHAARHLQQGDFSSRIKVHSDDTLGDAAKGLTDMISSVATLLNNIQNSAHEVNELSVKLQAVTDESKGELDKQNMQTQHSASAATEMAATVREVAKNCVDANNATEIARQSALEGQQKVNEAIAKINVLGNDVEVAKDIISQLQTDVTDIGAVLEVIRSIADQTNLLALNAAIEAARAGEQGRGFAVVADEVRSLAKRTQDSTEEIRSVIEKLQERAGNAVSIIHQSFTGATESVARAASAGESLEKIVVGVELLRDLNLQITTAAEEQAAVAEEMSRNTNHLSDSSEKILGQVEKTVAFSATLRKSALSLLDNTMKFKT